MKQLITAFAIAAMLPMSLAAAGPYDITWYKGKTFSNAAAISNNTAESFGRVYGIFPEGTTIEVPANTTVTISGPNDSHLRKTTTLSANPSKSQQDPNSENPGDIIQVVYPGVYFWISNSEWYSVKTPGVYTVNFPAGTFKVNGAGNEAFDVNFIVEDNRTFTPVDMTFTPTPSDGYSGEKFTEFKLTVKNRDDDGNRLYGCEGVKAGSKLKVTDIATNDVYEYDINTISSGTGTLAFNAICNPAINRSGTYRVEWPEGFMKLYGNDDASKLYTNKAYSYTVTCTGNGDNNPPVVSQDLVWSEGDQWATRASITNNTVNALGTIWGEMQGKTLDVPYGSNPARKKAIVTGPAEGYTTGKECNIDRVLIPNSAGDGTEVAPAFKVIVAEAPTYVKTPGEYTIAIPAGAFKIDGSDNAAIEYKITVKDTRDYKPIDLPIDHVYPTPDGASSTTTGTLADISIYIKNESVNGTRPYQSMGVSSTVKPIITLPDGTSRSWELKDLGTYTNMLRYYVAGDYGYTAAGRYTLTIPQGAILLASGTVSGAFYTNKELTYTWTLDGKPAEVDHKIMLTPSSHDVQALAGIEVSSPDDLFLRVNDPSKITVTTPSGDVKVLKSIVSPNELYINCFRENEIFTEMGVYKFNIAEGAISFVDTDNNVFVSTRSYSYDYNVTGGEVGELAYKITDSDGNEVSGNASTYSMSAYYVQFDKTVTPTTYPYCTVEYPDGSKQFIKATWGGNPGRFMIFPGYPKQMGEYKFIFPAGAALADGVFNGTIEFTVTQLDQNMVDLAVTSDPQSGTEVTELHTLTLTGSADEYTSLTRVNGGITMTYFQNDDNPDGRQMQYLKTSSDPLRLSIELDAAVTEVGDYTWIIPAESIYAVKKDGSQVVGAEMKFFWSIRNSGVAENICENDATVTVYDMNGVCILNEAAHEELAKLPKGVYIINGKTFILK